MAIYELWADASESYFFELAESNEVTIPAGMPPQWVRFTVPSVPLEHERNPPLYPACLIGIQTGDTAGVARDYGDARPDERGNWRSIADPYSDGASGQSARHTADRARQCDDVCIRDVLGHTSAVTVFSGMLGCIGNA